MSQLRLFALTDAEANQVRTYIAWAEREGSYCEPKKHWDRRHAKIKEAFGMSAPQADQETGGEG